MQPERLWYGVGDGARVDARVREARLRDRHVRRRTSKLVVDFRPDADKERKDKTRIENKQNTNKGQISLVKMMISAVDIEQVKVKLNENCALV